MIELMLGMILILILVAGTIQFMVVAFAHAGLDGNLRGEVGLLALSPQAFQDTPRYIQTWDPGADGQRLTADDQAKLTSSRTLAVIANDSIVQPTDWNFLNALSKGCSLRQIDQSAAPEANLGFVKKTQALSVSVSDVAQNLFYASDTIIVKEEVWLPILNGLY